MENLEEKKFEEIIGNLEEVVKELENGTTDLEDTINKYTEAMKMVKVCDEKLANARETVNKILKENGELEDFNIENTTTE